jgi:hypothetical protein
VSFPSSNANGTQAATIGTEHTLATINTVGTFVLNVDTKNMVNGDVLELRVYKKILTGSTITVGSAGQFVSSSFANVQADQGKASIPVISLYSYVATLKQTAGTGRNFDWNVEQIA